MLGLDTIAAVLRELGDPQTTFSIVHVAGTNGKGSVCAFVASALTHAGFLTGKFISPYLVTPCDAVTINNVPIHDAAWSSAITNVGAAASTNGLELTTFELWTSAAFVIFAETKVDIAVIEVGVGGLTDATNVIPTPLAAGICAIGLDHQNLLGSTIEAIAGHKAGIIKPGGWAAVASAQQPNVIHVCKARASSVGAELTVAQPLLWRDKLKRIALDPASGSTFPIPLRGDYQLDNAGLALALLRRVGAADERLARLRDDAVIAAGFSCCKWRGRFERISVPIAASQTTLSFWLDGGHNAHALQRVREEVDCILAEMDAAAHNDDVSALSQAACDDSAADECVGKMKRPVLFIYGGTDSRSIEENLSLLLRSGDALFAVPFPAPEGMPWIRCHSPDAIVKVASAMEGVKEARGFATLEDAIAAAAERFPDTSEAHSCSRCGKSPRAPFRMICGSLYLVSEVYRTILA